MMQTLEEAEAAFDAAVISYNTGESRAACVLCDDSGLVFMVVGQRRESEAERERRIATGESAPRMRILNKSEIGRYSYLARNAGPCPDCRKGEGQRAAAEKRGRPFRLTREAVRRHFDTHFYPAKPQRGAPTTEQFIQKCREVDG